MAKDEILEVAKYVAKNTPAWLTDKDKGNDVKVTKLVGGTLIVDETQQDLTKGVQYSYRTGDVQGLTGVKSNKLLYGSMAPDQYALPKAIHLDEGTINALAELKGNDKDKEEVKQALRGIPLTSLQGGGENHVFDAIGSSDRSNNLKIGDILQAFVGKSHIEAVANKIGNGEEVKQYAVLTLAGNKQAETKGFGISNESMIDKSNTTVTDIAGISRPTVAVYKGHNNHIAQQMVIQTENKLDEKEKKLCMTSDDAEKIVSFYKDTMGKGTPVAVNCTDGLDRTGVMMVGLQMLHQYNQGNDLTAKKPVEQQRDLLKLVDDLKDSRGAYFVRGTADTARGVALGHLLIATQKRNDLQSKNESESDLKAAGLAVKEATQAFEEANQIDTPFSYNLKEVVDTEKKVQELSGDVKKDIIKIEDAPTSKYAELLKAGYDISSFKKGDKNGYDFAVDKFLKDPKGNSAGMSDLLKFGGEKARKEVGSALSKEGYQPKLVNLILKSDNKEALKETLSGIGFKEREALRKDLDKLSSKVLQNSSLGERLLSLVGLGNPPDAPFKKIKDALPSKEAALTNDKNVSSYKTSVQTPTQGTKAASASVPPPQATKATSAFVSRVLEYEKAVANLKRDKENFNKAKQYYRADISDTYRERVYQDSQRIVGESEKALEGKKKAFEEASEKIIEKTSKDVKNPEEVKEKSLLYKDHVVAYEQAEKSLREAGRACLEDPSERATKALQEAAVEFQVKKKTFEEASGKVNYISKMQGHNYLNPSSSDFERKAAMDLIGNTRINPLPVKDSVVTKSTEPKAKSTEEVKVSGESKVVKGSEPVKMKEPSYLESILAYEQARENCNAAKGACFQLKVKITGIDRQLRGIKGEKEGMPEPTYASTELGDEHRKTMKQLESSQGNLKLKETELQRAEKNLQKAGEKINPDSREAGTAYLQAITPMQKKQAMNELKDSLSKVTLDSESKNTQNWVSGISRPITSAFNQEKSKQNGSSHSSSTPPEQKIESPRFK